MKFSGRFPRRIDAIVYMSRGRLVIHAARLEGEEMWRKCSVLDREQSNRIIYLHLILTSIITGLYLCQLHASHKNRAISHLSQFKLPPTSGNAFRSGFSTWYYIYIDASRVANMYGKRLILTLLRCIMRQT